MADTLRFDIVVAGGSLSAPATALSAARDNPKARILLVEPTDWLGGQATSQGVSAVDNAWFDPGRTMMAEDQDGHYAKDWLRLLRSMNEPGVPGTGLAPNGTSWVSREAFDPRSAAFVLDRMVAEHANITVMKMTAVKDVETRRGAIAALTLVERTPAGGYVPFSDFLSEEIADWYSPEDSRRFRKRVVRIEPADPSRGLVVVDATELADVAVLSGAMWTQGRELESEEAPFGTLLPALDDLGSQATVFVFCMGDAPSPSDEGHVKSWFKGFDAYLDEQTANYFSLRHFTWQKVWTYRRLLTKGTLQDFDSVHRGDVSMQNWEPGNDYARASMLLGRAETEAQRGDWRGGVNTAVLAECEKHAVAWYFWMKNHRPTEWDTQYLCGNHAMNMMGTPHGLAKFPYVRCARRIAGPGGFRIMGKHWKNSQAPGHEGPSERYFDRVGIGSYAADVHPTKVTHGVELPFERPAPFYIPLRALVSGNVANLLAAGKNMAQTYVTNSAYRLHPIEWASGSAAGVAASTMLRDGVEGKALLDASRLKDVQARVRQNSPIGWKAYGD